MCSEEESPIVAVDFEDQEEERNEGFLGGKLLGTKKDTASPAGRTKAKGKPRSGF